MREPLVVLCERGSSPPPYIGAHGQFGGRIFPDPPPHRHPTLNNEPPERGGLKACQQGHRRAPSAAAPGLGPLGSSFAWLASGWAWIVVVLWIGPDLVFGLASWVISVDLQFCFLKWRFFSIIPLYLVLIPVKWQFSNTSGIRSIVNVYVCWNI